LHIAALNETTTSEEFYNMTKYLKYKPAWLQLLVFGSLSFGFYLCFGLLAMFGVAALNDLPVLQLQELDFKNQQVVKALKELQAVITIVIFLLPALVFAYLSDRKPMQYIGLKKPVPLGFWWLGAMVMVFAFPLAAWLNQVNQHMHLPAFLKGTEESIRVAEARADDLLTAMLTMNSPADLVAMLIVIALLPAICEELFFRGVLQRLFIQICQRPATGILVTALLFSAFHGQFLGFFTRALLGVILGAIYWYSGSIWPGIIAHFLNNALQVLYVYKDKSFINKEPQLQPMLVICSALVVIALLWYMRRISHTHFGELYDTDDEMVLPSKEAGSREQ
jgi:uncharacterized protein